MHVDVSPRRFDLVPGIPQTIAITLANTGDVIGGYQVRVLGADPSWVTLEEPEVTLFPTETRVSLVHVSVPPGMTAGERRLSIQVRETTPPEASVVEDVAFVVPEAPSSQLRVDPMAATAGRTARFNLLIANDGNTRLTRDLHGQDAESRVRFEFSPRQVDLMPGEHALVDVRAKAKRPLTGSPVVRPLELRLLTAAQSADLARAAAAAKQAGAPAPTPVAPAAPADPAAPMEQTAGGEQALETEEAPAPKAPGSRKAVKPRRARKARPPLFGEDLPPVGQMTFVQTAALSRGSMSLVGLLVAVTVFALVITVALSSIVGQSAEDRDLALEIAAASNAGGGVGDSVVGGTVRLLTSGKPVEGVGVSIFSADDTEKALTTTATSKAGTWRVGELPAGDYKVTFRGAGFVQLWYPQAVDPADAETVTLEAGDNQAGLDVTLGGVPSSISGSVVGDDVSNATLTLKNPITTVGPAGSTASAPAPAVVTPLPGAEAAATSPTAAAAEEGATITSVPIGSDGTFDLTDVPSPSVYDLVVEKEGYATSTQRIDVSAGEEREGVEITLRQGDGLITGSVTSAEGPVGEAAVTATAGQSTVTTMSLDGDGADAGEFSLRGLPTPSTLTLVISAPDFASQTLTVSLAEGQQLTGVAVNLVKSAGSIGGEVTQEPDGEPAPGVLVTVTDGAQTVQTATQSSGDGIGRWQVSGLALPGEYTVTFSRSDLEAQTLSVDLDAQGGVTSSNGGSGARQVDARLRSSTATLAGVITRPATTEERDAGRTGPQPAGETVVQLVSTAATYSVTSATVPTARAGAYRFDAVPPGTYTLQTSRNGVTPTARIITLTAGETVTQNLSLDRAAAVRGVVTGGANEGWVVELYRSGEFPGTVYRSTRLVRDDGALRFTFTDVDAPQAYVVQVRRTAGSSPSGSCTVDVDRSENASCTIDVSNDG